MEDAYCTAGAYGSSSALTLHCSGAALGRGSQRRLSDVINVDGVSLPTLDPDAFRRIHPINYPGLPAGTRATIETRSRGLR